MRRIAVDLSQSTCAVAEAPRRLTNYETGQPKTDPETGEVLSSIKVLVQTPSEMSIIAVTAPSASIPEHVKINDSLTITGLVAEPWVNDAGSLVERFKATRVEAASKVKAA